MERTFFDQFGLEKNQIDSILNEHSKDIGSKVNEITDLNQKVQALQTTIDELNGKLETANSTINNLKNSNKDNESLQDKVKEYQEQIKQMQASFDLERKHNAIIAELTRQDFIHPELVMNLIDTDKVIKANDGTYSGLTEQIDAITANENYGYLRNTPKGGNSEPAVTIDRGGYDPNTGTGIPENLSTPSEKKLIGEIVGLEVEAKQKAQTESAENFWNSLG